MKSVRRTPDGRLISFHKGERELLSGLVSSYRQLVSEVIPDDARGDDLAARLSTSVVDFEMIEADPALNRLFPPAYASEQDAADFRRYTEVDAARTKLAESAVVLADLVGGDRVLVRDANYLAWLRTITSLRLVIHERDQGDLAELQDWLGWLLEGLLTE